MVRGFAERYRHATELDESLSVGISMSQCSLENGTILSSLSRGAFSFRPLRDK